MKCPNHGVDGVLHTTRKKGNRTVRYYRCPNGHNFKVTETPNVLPETPNVLSETPNVLTETPSVLPETPNVLTETVSSMPQCTNVLPPITKELVESAGWTAGKWLEEWLKRNIIPPDMPYPAPPPGLDMSDWPGQARGSSVTRGSPINSKALGF